MIFHSFSYIYNKMKKCTKCNINPKHSTTSYCRECRILYNKTNKEHIKLYNKERYESDKEIILDKIKNYNKKHNDKIKKYAQDWFQKNKDHINKYNRDKYKNDPIFKLKLILRNILNKKLKDKKAEKYKSSLILIGCNIQELKQHLESQFLPEMTWENHGIIWEIDHIKPCTSFDLTKKEEQSEAFHYTNLQPLFKTTDIAKSFGYNDHIGNRNKNKYEK